MSLDNDLTIVCGDLTETGGPPLCFSSRSLSPSPFFSLSSPPLHSTPLPRSSREFLMRDARDALQPADAGTTSLSLLHLLYLLRPGLTLPCPAR